MLPILAKSLELRNLPIDCAKENPQKTWQVFLFAMKNIYVLGFRFFVGDILLLNECFQYTIYLYTNSQHVNKT